MGRRRSVLNLRGNGIFDADFLRLVDENLAVFVATNSLEDREADIASEVANRALDGARAFMQGPELDHLLPLGLSETESERLACAVRRDDRGCCHRPRSATSQFVTDRLPTGRVTTELCDRRVGKPLQREGYPEGEVP